ncbi:MAG: prepilin-type N-terminal cleavage/methylation domain-containing protein, partial [Fastidiosipila sp.]|nr:prepilin-type N-terminal cleavage/methylation domain-containing protein [Fastidiosipila sp.]
MRKWKHICHSKKRQSSRSPKIQLLNNEAGVTLVELLAAIAILGIVIALAGSVHIFGQRQFRSQTKSANQTNDLSHALTVMSTDLRRYNANQVRVTENGEIEVSNYLNSEDGYVLTYYVSNKKLLYKGTVLIDDVSHFYAKKIDNKGIHIEISVSSTDPGVEAKNYQTTIYFRAESPETTA